MKYNFCFNKILDNINYMFNSITCLICLVEVKGSSLTTFTRIFYFFMLSKG